jgi:hypothetical protein
MEHLVGKTISSIQVNQDQQLLKFTTNTGEEIIYEAVGDCCSSTWFADIIFYGGRYAFPFSVTKVEEIEVPRFVNRMADKDGRGRQEYEEVYGYNIVASKAISIQIVYRNSSNGYYGGWCELFETLNSKHAQKILDECVWTNITEDWSA